jgi:NIMA (never in mitosis gene a)-related kinase
MTLRCYLNWVSTLYDVNIFHIGDGAYSSVYKVKRIIDGEIYALKKVKLHHLSDKEKENAINEVRILASIKQRNIIAYKEAFIEAST